MVRPDHSGHQAVLQRAALLFDEVVVCVMVNPAKSSGRLPIAERLDRLRAAVAAAGLGNVTVDAHIGGLLVDYCRRAGIEPSSAAYATVGTWSTNYQWPT